MRISPRCSPPAMSTTQRRCPKLPQARPPSRRRSVNRKPGTDPGFPPGGTIVLLFGKPGSVPGFLEVEAVDVNVIDARPALQEGALGVADHDGRAAEVDRVLAEPADILQDRLLHMSTPAVPGAARARQ